MDLQEIVRRLRAMGPSDVQGAHCRAGLARAVREGLLQRRAPADRHARAGDGQLPHGAHLPGLPGDHLAPARQPAVGDQAQVRACPAGTGAVLEPHQRRASPPAPRPTHHASLPARRTARRETTLLGLHSLTPPCRALPRPTPLPAVSRHDGATRKTPSFLPAKHSGNPVTKLRGNQQGHRRTSHARVVSRKLRT